MMTRRAFLSASAAATAGAAAPALFSRPARAQSSAPPNIVFIFTDDQAAWTIRGLGNANPVTPHLDRLFSESAQCANAFVTTPVCSPSRAGLICSRYGTELGILDWIKPPDENSRNEEALGLDPATPTWVRQLRDAGYHTGLMGKWHLGTLDKYHPSVFGYEQFSGIREGGCAVENPTLEIGGEKKVVEGLTVDIFTDLACDFIMSAQQPFLLSLHHRSPHRKWLPSAPEDTAALKDKKLELPNPDYPELDLERVEQLTGEYLQSVHGVDRSVGRILALLDELKLADNTVVVFTSDHGYNIGHHGIIHKGNASWITKQIRGLSEDSAMTKRPNMFDTSLRVPVAVRWPGRLRGGHVVQECVTNLDWYPTLLAMAGVADVPAGIHGRNFLPLLQGESIPWKNDFYGEYSMHHTAAADMRMYRTPEWKLVRDLKNIGRDELYCLADDPGETLNLLYSSRGAEIYPKLNAALRKHMESISDPLLSKL